MKAVPFLVAAGALCVTAGAVTQTPAGTNLHRLMKNIVSVQTQAIWDVGNHAQDDDGNPDASKIKPADWNRLLRAGQQVKQAAQFLAETDHVTVAARGEAIEDEEDPGAFNAARVQSTIDANPGAFRAFASALVAPMDEVLTAARTKDALKLADISGRLDEVCENCHKQFWYPDQKTGRP